jgi:hypothetical protein
MPSWSIYWWPEGAPTYRVITLPLLSRLEDATFRDVTDAVGAVTTRLDRGAGRRVRITSVIHRVNNESAWLALRSIDSYLRSGGRVSVGLSDQMYLGFVTRAVVSGSTVMTTGGNVLPYDTPSLASGDYLRLERTGPDLTEIVKLSSISAGKTITISSGTNQGLGSGVAVRPLWTFPVAYMPAEDAASDTRWLSDERHPGLIWDMDLTLEERPGELFALYEGGLATETEIQRYGKKSLNQIVGEAVLLPQFGSSVQGPGGRYR